MKHLFIILKLLIFYSSLTQAQQVATLDVSFDTDGVQYFDYSNELRGAKILVQPDGKIISATAFLWIYTLGSDIRYTFNRYNANGSIDNTFGTNGQITHSVDYSTPTGEYVKLEAIKLQADGKIVAVGGSNQGTGLIVRINANGTLDNTFDTDGILKIASIGGFSIAEFTDVAIQTNNKIVLTSRTSISGSNDFAIVRLNSDGTLDLGFDADGLVTTSFGSSEVAKAVTIQSDGKIVVGGENNVFTLCTARYTSTGALDTSYDTDGKQTTVLTTSPFVEKILIQPDGKVLIGATSDFLNSHLAIFRYNANGSLDLSFNSMGYTITTFATDFVSDLLIQPDNKIITIGTQYISASTTRKVVLTRHNPDGSLDITFDNDGKYILSNVFSNNERAGTAALQNDGKLVISYYDEINDKLAITRLHINYNFNSNNGKMYATIGTSNDQANAIAIRPNGKIIAAGYSYNAVNGSSDNDFSLVAYNTDGSLDYTFGNNAVVKTEINAFSNDQINAIAIQPDGKIIAAGTTGLSTASNYAIVRYLADGSGLDPTFGVSGKVIVDISGTQDFVSSIVLQSDGKIVVGGSTVNGANADFSLIRLNPNGTLDNTFDADGKITTFLGASYNISSCIGIQTDGKIILAGYLAGNFGVVRYNTNGSLDNTFDADGKVNITIGPSSFEGVYGLVIQPDGKILVSGNTNFAGTTDFAVIRLNNDGSLDNGFGSGGKFWIDINTNSEDSNPSIALHASGKIMLAGVLNFDTIGLCRLNANGTLDTGFDSDGKMTLEFGYGIDYVKGIALQTDGKMLLAGYYFNGANNDFALIKVNGINDFSVNNGKMMSSLSLFDNAAFAMLEQPDGKVVMGGYAENNNTEINGNYNGAFALARYNTDGSLDNTFDNDGIATTFFNIYEDYCTAIAIQTDGKIVAVGTSFDASFNADFALARYNTNGSLDNTFGTGGKIITSVSATADYATSVVIQTDGKIVIGGASVVSNNKFSLFRYNSNGTVDNTFGTNGSVISAFGNSNSISKIALQTDSKIVAAGWVKNGSNFDFAITRYTTAGVLDNTFNATGILNLDLGSNSDLVGSINIQNDGKIIVGGNTSNGTNTDFAIIRLNTDGTLDNTFDTDGKVIIAVGSGNDNLKMIKILANGKILAVGQIFNGTDYDLGIVRINTNGSLDNSLNANGKFIKTIGYANDYANAIIYQASGNYLIGGSYFNGNNLDFSLTKIQACDIETPILVNSTDNYPNVALPNPQIGKSISATNLINTSANVIYRTSSSITLNAGFKADNGAVFKTEIVGCSY